MQTFKELQQYITQNFASISAEFRGEVEKQRDVLLPLIGKKDIFTGGWFEKIVIQSLAVYARFITLEKLEKRYRTTDTAELAKRAVNYYKMLNLGVGVVIGGVGGFFEFLAAAFTSIPEMIAVTYNKLCLIYELSTIYRNPLPLEDPVASFDIIMKCFPSLDRVRNSKGFRGILLKSGRRVVRDFGKMVVSREVRKVLRWAGKKVSGTFVTRFLAKSPPYIGAFFGAVSCGAFDYLSTEETASFALIRFYSEPLLLREITSAVEKCYKISNGVFFGRKKREVVAEMETALCTGCELIVGEHDAFAFERDSLYQRIRGMMRMQEGEGDGMRIVTLSGLPELFAYFRNQHVRDVVLEGEVKAAMCRVFLLLSLVPLTEEIEPSTIVKNMYEAGGAREMLFDEEYRKIKSQLCPSSR